MRLHRISVGQAIRQSPGGRDVLPVRSFFCALCVSVSSVFKSSALAVLILCLVASLPLYSQQRPLRTVEAEIVSPGTLRAEVGFDFLQDISYPLSGLSGDQTSVGVVDLRLGVGRMVEVQLEGAVRHFLDVKQRVPSVVTPQLSGTNSTNEIGDFSLFTKIRIFGETERRPALAFRFGFQMPNSKQARGIGTNTSNLFASFILQKHVGKVNLLGNVGLGILQAPATIFSQNDVLTFGGALIYPVHRRVNLVGEAAGRSSTRKVTQGLLGTESRSQGRFGVQVVAGGFQWDFAGIAGLTRPEASTGFTFGISRDFHLFSYEKGK